MNGRIKKILAVILTAVTLASCLPFGGLFGTSAMTVGELEKGATVCFGSYPQSLVTDGKIKSQLNGKLQSVGDGDWKSCDFAVGSGNWDDGNSEKSDIAKYCDIELQANEKYRAVIFTDYRPYLTGMKAGKNNSNVNENEYFANKVYFFKFESMKWRVLDPEKGLLVCQDIIDSQPFNDYIKYYSASYFGNSDRTHFASDYENSSLRQWLNGGFYSMAFADYEKENIIETVNENKSAYSEKYSGKDTKDMVFLLSEEEVSRESYGFAAAENDEALTRTAKGTDYSRCMGLFVNDGDRYTQEEYSHYLLRTSYSGSCVEYVDGDGSIKNYCNTSQTDMGVRPALCVSPDTIADRTMKTLSYNVSLPGKETVYKVNTLWGMSFFGEASEGYNNTLALVSLSLCNMTEKSPEAAENEMENLGFSSAKSYNYSAESQENGLLPPAVSFAYGVLEEKDSTKYVIAAAIRDFGGNLQSEKTDEMQSLLFERNFEEEADSIYENLKSYISLVEQEENVLLDSENTMLFITGHGLGGAAASRLAVKTLKDSLSKPANVFAYTFGSPKYSGVSGNNYKCIFNIFLENDRVTDLNHICCFTSAADKKITGGKRYGIDMKLKAPSDGAVTQVFTSKEKFDALHGKYHITPTYLASLLENTPEDMGHSHGGSYTVSEVRCIPGVTVTVYDKSGKAVGNIPQEDGVLAAGDFIFFRNSNICKIVVKDGVEYYLRFSSTVKSKMKFTQSLFDANGGSTVSSKKFSNVSLKPGRVLETGMLGSDEISDTRLFALSADGKRKEIEIETDGSEMVFVPLKSISSKDMEINYKSTKKLEYTVESDDDSYTLTFTSSDPNVVKVDEKGNVTGVARGSATVTCTATDGSGRTVSSSSTVTVSFSFFQWIIWIVLFGFLWY